MNREEILKAFSELSPEDQETVRTEIGGSAQTGGEGEFESPLEMCRTIMGKIEAGDDPMAVCKDMMAKCCA